MSRFVTLVVTVLLGSSSFASGATPSQISYGVLDIRRVGTGDQLWVGMVDTPCLWTGSRHDNEALLFQSRAGGPTFIDLLTPSRFSIRSGGFTAPELGDQFPARWQFAHGCLWYSLPNLYQHRTATSINHITVFRYPLIRSSDSHVADALASSPKDDLLESWSQAVSREHSKPGETWPTWNASDDLCVPIGSILQAYEKLENRHLYHILHREFEDKEIPHFIGNSDGRVMSAYDFAPTGATAIQAFIQTSNVRTLSDLPEEADPVSSKLQVLECHFNAAERKDAGGGPAKYWEASWTSKEKFDLDFFGPFRTVLVGNEYVFVTDVGTVHRTSTVDGARVTQRVPLPDDAKVRVILQKVDTNEFVLFTGKHMIRLAPETMVEDCDVYLLNATSRPRILDNLNSCAWALYSRLDPRTHVSK